MKNFTQSSSRFMETPHRPVAPKSAPWRGCPWEPPVTGTPEIHPMPTMKAALASEGVPASGVSSPCRPPHATAYGSEQLRCCQRHRGMPWVRDRTDDTRAPTSPILTTITTTAHRRSPRTVNPASEDLRPLQGHGIRMGRGAVSPIRRSGQPAGATDGHAFTNPGVNSRGAFRTVTGFRCLRSGHHWSRTTAARHRC
jgi:hypothetical protein